MGRGECSDDGTAYKSECGKRAGAWAVCVCYSEWIGMILMIYPSCMMCYAPCGCCVCAWQCCSNMWAVYGSSGPVCIYGKTAQALEYMGTAEVVAGCIRLIVFCLLLGMLGTYQSELNAYDDCILAQLDDDASVNDNYCAQHLTLDSRDTTEWVITTLDECLFINGVWIIVASFGAVSGLKGSTAEKAVFALEQERVRDNDALNRAEVRAIEMVPVAGAEPALIMAEPVRSQPSGTSTSGEGPLPPTAYAITVQETETPPHTFGQFRPPPPRQPVVHAIVVPGMVVNPNIRGMGTPLDGRPLRNERASSLDRNPVSVGRAY